VQRYIGFSSYKTDWYISPRIRAALQDKEFCQPMGIVDGDETWIGGKDDNRHWNKKHQSKIGPQASRKTPIIRAVTRKGNVVALVLDRVTKDAAQRFVREMVSDKVSLLATDETSFTTD